MTVTDAAAVLHEALTLTAGQPGYAVALEHDTDTLLGQHGAPADGYLWAYTRDQVTAMLDVVATDPARARHELAGVPR